ncbi:ABC transporter permease [Pseudomonas sp. LRF_L74]|uniref:ABC transporter permease n=1 Tax=Pseudomonas sp. LRF_L74 TaxID=3369422 RepID=UPI003F5E0744
MIIGFILRRSAFLLLNLLLVSILIFLIVNVLPGDIARMILGEHASDAEVAQLRETLGLNLPLLARYLDWLGDLLHGDLGQSLSLHRPVAELIHGRLLNSLILAGLALAMAVPLALLLASVAANRPGRLADRLISRTTTLFFSLPEYVIAILLTLIFSLWLDVLPGSSLMDANASPLSDPLALVLPVLATCLPMLAYLVQITRAGLIDILHSEYVRTATLKGLSRRTVIIRHALPNALPPTVTEMGLNFGYLLSGLVLIETIFSYAGIGQLTVLAINNRDLPLIQGCVLVSAFAYSAANLLADVVALLLTPRVRN